MTKRKRPTQAQVFEKAAHRSLGPARIVRALGNSRSGLAEAWRTEDAFRQEVIGAAILIPLSFFIPASLVEHALLIGVVLMVIMIELLNSAIESAIDRISAEIHPLSKRAKDLGSAAVGFAVVIAALVWCAILTPVILLTFGAA